MFKPPYLHILNDSERIAGMLSPYSRDQIGFVNGCFDLLHAGHVSLIQAAVKNCLFLVVGMNSDSSVRALKGSMRPIIGQTDRAGCVSSIKGVGAVVLTDDETMTNVLLTVNPGTWTRTHADVPYGKGELEFVYQMGVKVKYGGYCYGVSTSEIIRRITARTIAATERRAGYPC